MADEAKIVIARLYPKPGHLQEVIDVYAGIAPLVYQGQGCDLPVRTLRDRVPDGQTVRRKMKTVRTWQRVYVGKRVGKCRDWFFEQVKNRPVSGVSKRLRQSFKLVPSSVREAKNPVTH
jgi:hypothetical protein